MTTDSDPPGTEDEPETRARRRLILLIEEIHAAARPLGLEVPGDVYAPWRLRAEAWLYRAGRLLSDRDVVE